MRRTRVGTREVAARIRSTAADLTPYAFLYIQSRVIATFDWRDVSLVRLSDSLRFWSGIVPTSGILFLGVKQFGHGHAARLRIVASKTLPKMNRITTSIRGRLTFQDSLQNR